MEKSRKRPFLVLIAIILFAPFFVSAADAEFFLSPASGSFGVGSEFSVKVMIDPGGAKINVGEATINFDKNFLSVSGISKGASIFSLWTSEPEFSNTQGTIAFSGGTPSPFSNKSTVITVNFKVLKTGTAKVSFSKGSILAADGRGTDVFSRGLDASYTLVEGAGTAPSSVTPPPTTPSPVLGNRPEAPKITSSTHEKSDKWYSKSEAQFSWTVPSDVTSVATLMSKEKDIDPNKINKLHTPPVNSEKVGGLEDGEWYFYAQFKNTFGWGSVGSKKILIDTEPPLEFDIQLLSEGVHASVPKLSFETQDELSGIKYYEVSIGSATLKTVYPRELVSGLYVVPPHPGGNETVKVKAFDEAGNVREVSKELLIPYIAQPVVEEKTAPVEESPWTMERIITLLFVFLSGALFALNMYQKKQFKKEKAIILRESEEAEEKTSRVFAALREEIKEQIEAMDKKPQLTAAERTLLENMGEALDLSEELLSGEIEDIRKVSRDNK